MIVRAKIYKKNGENLSTFTGHGHWYKKRQTGLQKKETQWGGGRLLSKQKVSPTLNESEPNSQKKEDAMKLINLG